MTQDMAREFLTSKKEGDLYRLFMKATQLEAMIGRLSSTEAKVTDWTASLNKSRADLPVAEHAMETAKKVRLRLAAICGPCWTLVSIDGAYTCVIRGC
jgi:hypothetical protein